MRKLNILFSILVAFLSFNIAFDSFESGYNQSQYTILYQEQVDEKVVAVYFNLSADTFAKPNNQFSSTVVEFYESIGYDGYVIDRDIMTNNSQMMTMYISSSKLELFDHLRIRSDVSDYRFSDESERRIITNFDVYSNDSYVLPFDRWRDSPTTSILNERITYVPIHQLKDKPVKLVESPTLMMYFLVPPEDVGNFVENYFAEFYIENFVTAYDDKTLLIESETFNLFYGEDKVIQSYIEPSMTMPFSLNPLVYPGSMLYLTMFSLISVLVGVSLDNAKELAIRDIHGNRRLKTFRIVYGSTILKSCIAFIATLAILAIFRINFYNHVTLRFFKILIIICMIFLAITLVTTVACFTLFSALMRLKSVKGNIKTRSLQFMSTVFKVITILTMVPILIESLDFISVLNRYIAAGNSQSQRVGDVLIDHIDYGNQTNYQYSIEKNKFVFESAESFDISFVSNDSFHQYGLEYDYLVVNRSALKEYDFYTSSGKLLDTKNLEVSTLIVPQDKVGSIRNPDNVPIEIVQYTPIFSTGVLMENDIVENPPLYVIVDSNDEIHLNGINSFSLYARSFEEDNFIFFIETLKDGGVDPSIFPVSDLMADYLLKFRRAWTQLLVVLGGVIILIILFSSMIVEAFYQRNRKLLAVQYLLGFSRVKRYERLITTIFLSTTVSFLLVLTNSFFKIFEFAKPTSNGYLLLFMVMFLLIDAVLVLIWIHTTERKMAQSVLKGDS
ncbi:hypothetical protein G7062_07180 [Erysipelothrix sp. HDW6C]|uniref:hypothetical protein n=1 Tax=Erysipelothrix sp. HDW6C TaxID=2714930 RepID=UPI001409A7C9|nr:hypothetical protein [Erysipelothrix sp. HDW6C]QIK70077.1 hypothetical protein G7062_07180 [Erysipelothrix sp. HDW6C]